MTINLIIKFGPALQRLASDAWQLFAIAGFAAVGAAVATLIVVNRLKS